MTDTPKTFWQKHALTIIMVTLAALFALVIVVQKVT
jgi:hypothetical protein